MPASTPNCACPLDSPLQLLVKFNNNLVLTLKTMSANRWTGQLVSTIGRDGCGCSELQILSALNNNIVSFFSWLSVNGVSGSQAGNVSLSNGDASKAVVFATAFAAKPSVVAVVAAPDNTGYVISLSPDDANVSATGFTALFGAAMPAAGYRLYWIATPTTQ